MARESSPAFQFYPQDFLADDKVALMSPAARGCYIVLLCHCWLHKYLPKDLDSLSNLARANARSFPQIWRSISSCFRDTEHGLVNPRIEREREKQAIFRENKRKAGKAGGKQTQSRRQADVQAKSTSSSSSSSSSSVSNQKDLANQNVQASTTGEVTRANGNGSYVSVSLPINGTTDSDLAERAGRFCERYAELYPKHRKGARYLPKPALDWPKAIDLCRTWDDARLEKLAIVFLKTDHDFATKGSRTIGQFAALASWCDDRLREVESGGR